MTGSSLDRQSRGGPLRQRTHHCKGLKAERAYYLDKTASTIVSMTVAKAFSQTAEERKRQRKVRSQGTLSIQLGDFMH